jgi:ribosomal protein S18 acetylase RimI-like enzyme
MKMPYDYIQMRLPVEKITKNFEEKLKNKIEHNILHAEIRKATKEDSDSIINMYNQAWHSTTMPFRPISKKKLVKLFNNPSYNILIAKVGSIDGAFAIIYLMGDKKEIGVIGALGVIPEFHHKGLGTILGMGCWDYFKRKGVSELRCAVHFDNKASYIFIRSLGFEEFRDKDGYRYVYTF